MIKIRLCYAQQTDSLQIIRRQRGIHAQQTSLPATIPFNRRARFGRITFVSHLLGLVIRTVRHKFQWDGPRYEASALAADMHRTCLHRPDAARNCNLRDARQRTEGVHDPVRAHHMRQRPNDIRAWLLAHLNASDGVCALIVSCPVVVLVSFLF
ncbi:hypothetical protein FB451DRAFT_1260081 [Mycena latifolia]|nr:hypothetical protein FB451DRAFT_1260081 [Mycena latifolia]